MRKSSQHTGIELKARETLIPMGVVEYHVMFYIHNTFDYIVAPHGHSLFYTLYANNFIKISEIAFAQLLLRLSQIAANWLEFLSVEK